MGRLWAGLVSGVWIFLLFVAVFGVVLNVPVVRASGTIYIRADGSIDPPTAPIQRNGDLYTFTENIYDSIVVERDNIVVDGAGYIVQGAGTGRGIDLSSRNNVTVKNSRISRFDHGILVNGTGKIVIEKNRISDNSESGIMIIGKSNVLIKENTIKLNKNGIATDAEGVHSGIVVANNTIMSNQEKGIYIYSYSSGYGSYGQSFVSYIYNVTVSFNNVSSNGGDGILLHSYSYTTGYGFPYSYVYDVIFSSNNVSSNGGNGIYLYSRASSTCELGKSYIYNVVIANSAISSNMGNGIYLYSYASVGWLSSSGRGYGYIYNVTVSNSTISSNSENGIFLYSQGSRSTDIAYAAGYAYIYNVNISSCTILLNGGDGIYLHGYGYGSVYVHSSSADGFSYIYNIVFSFNNVSLNEGAGIQLYSYGEAHGTTYGGRGYGYIYEVAFSSNIVSYNNRSGIQLYSFSYGSSESYGYIYDTTVSSNTVSFNKENGVNGKARNHYGQFDLTMSNNTISVNYQKGIWIDGGLNANLTHNSVSYNLYGFLFTQATNNLAQFNDIYYNSYGMCVTDGATVNAEYNYWGNASGPYHESLNMNGTGNSVNGNGVDLDFIPFLTEPIGQIIERPVVRARITVNVDPVEVVVGQNVTINGTITPARIGVNVTISYRPSLETWATLDTVQTNSNACYIYTWKTIVSGTYEIKATWLGDESILPGESETKTVTIHDYIAIRQDGRVDPLTAPIWRVGNLYTITDNINCGIVVERSNIIIDGDGYTLQGSGSGDGFYVSTNIYNVTIRGVNIKGFYHGVYLGWWSWNSTLSGNNITNNMYGIHLYLSDYNSISGNNIAANSWYGIELSYSSSNTVAGNNITNNSAGVELDSSNNNTISGNNITAGYIGIYVQGSNNSISSNSVMNNDFGITIAWSSNNTIAENKIISNGQGVSIVASSNNKIYHNNFVNNTEQVHINYAGYTSVWDDGYPSGGNYWSDYTGQDLNGDGIGNTPYVIDENNQDRYPLMRPYGEIPEDVAPPTTVHDYDGLWHTTDFTITLTATDDSSGVAETYYKINDGPTKTVSADGQPLITTEGTNNTLEYWSVDNAGNEELPHKILTGIKLDKTYPTIETPSRTPDGDVLPDQSVKVSVNVTDFTSGVKNVTLYYTINDGETWTDLPMNHTASNLYEATIPPQEVGTWVRFKIVAYDHAGNNATLDGTQPYCIYQVIPEFSPSLILPIFMIITLLAAIAYKRKHPPL